MGSFPCRFTDLPLARGFLIAFGNSTGTDSDFISVASFEYFEIRLLRRDNLACVVSVKACRLRRGDCLRDAMRVKCAIQNTLAKRSVFDADKLKHSPDRKIEINVSVIYARYAPLLKTFFSSLPLHTMAPARDSTLKNLAVFDFDWYFNLHWRILSDNGI